MVGKGDVTIGDVLDVVVAVNDDGPGFGWELVIGSTTGTDVDGVMKDIDFDTSVDDEFIVITFGIDFVLEFGLFAMLLFCLFVADGFNTDNMFVGVVVVVFGAVGIDVIEFVLDVLSMGCFVVFASAASKAVATAFLAAVAIAGGT